jgi:hypothetical protein
MLGTFVPAVAADTGPDGDRPPRSVQADPHRLPRDAINPPDWLPGTGPGPAEASPGDDIVTGFNPFPGTGQAPGSGSGLAERRAAGGRHKQHSVLAIRVYWGKRAKAAKRLPSSKRITRAVADANQFYRRVSNGRLSFHRPTITKLIRIRPPRGSCGTRNGYVPIAKRAFRALGNSTVSRFDHRILFLPCKSGSATAGLGTTSPDNPVVWIFSNALSRKHPRFLLSTVVAHELGHNLTLLHAKSAACTRKGQPVISGGQCQVEEYGDPWDLMGKGGAITRLNDLGLSAIYRARLGWLPRSQIAKVGRAGKFTLTPDTGGDGLKALLIKRRKAAYWVEYRPERGVGIGGGVQVRLAKDNGHGLVLLDATPGSIRPAKGIYADSADANIYPGGSIVLPGRIRIAAGRSNGATATVRVKRGVKASIQSANRRGSMIFMRFAGQVVSGGTIAVPWTFIDPDQTPVQQVEYIVDGGTPVRSYNEVPGHPWLWSFDGSGLTPGRHRLTMRSTDAKGTVRETNVGPFRLSFPQLTIGSVPACVTNTPDSTATVTFSDSTPRRERRRSTYQALYYPNGTPSAVGTGTQPGTIVFSTAGLPAGTGAFAVAGQHGPYQFQVPFTMTIAAECPPA